MEEHARKVPGTIVWFAPFYNRTGYGVGSRTIVTYMHRLGLRIKTVAMDQVEPGIDDTDIALIRSLEKTPVVPPVTAIVCYVAHECWLKIDIPEPTLRILATTVFDFASGKGSPPESMMRACRIADQIWVHVDGEREAFLESGFPPEKVHTLYWPHPWLENPLVPPPCPEPSVRERAFRFLSIAMFMPRRRWDTLIEAYLEEFKNEAEKVELYLKVTYPFWHPFPEQPRRDFYKLIDSLRRKTGSRARIVIDEDLGTRLGILRLIDSCHVYISTDTALTAPIAEARVRRRMIVIPEGVVALEPNACVHIRVDAEAKRPVTPEMFFYQPYHKDMFMPLLHVEDVRRAMRQAFEMSPEERRERAERAANIPGPSETVPKMIEAIHLGWRYKSNQGAVVLRKEKPIRVVWQGSQLVRHSLAKVNRELCLRLIESGCEVSIIPYEKDDMDPNTDPRWMKIVQHTYRPLSGPADVHVRHLWPPDFTPPPEGRWVMIQPWEFGSLPKSWVGPMSTLVDEMWVPSSFVRRCYVRSGIPPERVFVVPNGVDTNVYRPDAPPVPIKTRKGFRFLFVGGTIYRKGIDILLAAYAAVFSSRDDVCLVIKDMGGDSFYRNQTAHEMVRRFRLNPDFPEVEYIDFMMEEKAMPGLYTACDCLVHPYRGEGFGLPIAEAMACGLPVVVTGYGAALDFCTRDNAYFIPSEVRRFPAKYIDDLETVDFPWLVEPDREALGETMRRVWEHPQEAKEKGQSGRKQIERNFTWTHAAEVVKRRIEALVKKPILRMSMERPMAKGS